MIGIINNIAFNAFKLGDKRLNNRLSVLYKQLGGSIGTSTPVAIHDRNQTKAYYRFINNAKVLFENLTAGYGTYSIEQTKAYDVILAIQDTTTLNYSSKKAAPNLDCLESDTDKGFMLHNHLLVNGLGCPVGLFSQRFFARKAGEMGSNKSNRRKKMPFEEKESYRWLEEFNALQEAYKDDTDKLVVQVCDREADIHEVLQARKYDHVHYIIRSSYERVDDDKTKSSIWQQVADQAFAYEYDLEIPEGRKRSARTATMQVRYTCVTINAGYRKGGGLHPSKVWVLETKEVSNVPEGEEPICWRLLTSIEILSPKIAALVIQYYVFRWLIERFHYVLKQGLCAEDLQIKEKMALQNAIVLKSWQALDVMTLAYMPKVAPEMRLLEAGFSMEEYTLAYVYAKTMCNSKEKQQSDPMLVDFVRLIAQIGGHSLQAKKPIGVVSIWRGWTTFCLIKDIAKLLNNTACKIDVDVGVKAKMPKIKSVKRTLSNVGNQ